MSTVFDYLEELKQKNPEYRYKSNVSLYRELKAQDPNMPSWSTLDSANQRHSNLDKRYESKNSPDFVNSLFNWTDYGIDEGSSRWAKMAYNNSITGLAYQLYNGEERFKIDDYDTAIWEDILSAVASFSMPLDIATMMTGGIAGRAVKGSLASTSMQSRLSSNLVKGVAKKESRLTGIIPGAKAATNKQAREKIARQFGEHLVDEGEYTKLFDLAMPRTGQAVGQAVTLAAFEGTRGGMQAAVDGTDIWEGIGHGVAHGGFMGGIAGLVGGSLNVKHAKLFDAMKNQPHALSLKQQIEYQATGVVGQVGAEAAIFTAPEIPKMIQDDSYTMRDLTRTFATNVGMMGLLKAQHKLMGEAKQELAKYMDKEGNNLSESAKRALETIKETERQVDEMPTETPAQRKAKESAKIDVENFRKRQLKKLEIDIKDYENWEKNYEQALKDIERFGDEIPKSEIDVITNIYHQIQKVHGAMVRNVNRGNKEFTDARKVEIEKTKNLMERFEKEIIEPLNSLDKLQKKSEKLTDAERSSRIKDVRMSFAKAWDKATRQGDKKSLRELRRGVEDKITEEGKIVDEAAYIEIKENVDRYNKASQKQFKQTTEKATRETFEEAYESKDDVLNLSPKNNKEYSIEEINKLGDKTRKGKREIIETIEDILIEDVGTGKERTAYNLSKKILDYIGKKIFFESGLTTAKTELNHLRKFAKELAKNNESLFDVTDKKIQQYMQTTKVKKEAIVKLVKGLQSIQSRLDAKKKDLFNIKDFEIINLDPSKISAQVSKWQTQKLMAERGEGLQLSTESGLYEVKDNKIILPEKKGIKLKYISSNLQSMLKKLISKSKKLIGLEENTGQEKYLFKNKDNTALTTDMVNGLARFIFGTQKGAFGEGREFRYTIETWGNKRYKGEEAWKNDIIDSVIVGHGEAKTMQQTYSQKIRTEGGMKKLVDSIIKDFLSDIKKGKNVVNKVVQGYTTKQLQKGIKDYLSKEAPNEIEYTYTVNKKKYKQTINKKDAEAMIRYMIETGPRLNEIAPTKGILKESIDFASTKYQLDSTSKVSEIIASTKELTNQIKWVNKKFPQLTVAIEKTLGKVNGQYVLGKIQGHLIKIAENRAKIDTLPHEVAHHVVDALRALGDPFSKKIVNEGIRQFKKKNMSNKQAEEAFVEALGKYTSKQLPKNMMGRMKAWVSRAMSHLRQYFGITNKQDVIRMQKEIVEIVGGKVLSGRIPTDYLSLNKQMKVKHQLSNTKQGKKIVKATQKRIEKAEKDMKEPELGYKDKDLIEIQEILFGEKIDYKKSKVSDLEVYERTLKMMYEGRLGKSKSKKAAKNEALVERLESEYNISEQQRNKFFEDMWNIKFEDAGKEAIKYYKSHIVKGEKVSPLNHLVTGEILQLANSDVNQSTSIVSRIFMTSADVIRKMGPAGEKIADRLLAHDYIRSVIFKGPGEKTIHEITKIVDSKTRKNYMHYLDKNIAERAIKQLQKLIKKYPNQNKYKKELAEGIEVYENFHGKEGAYKEAAKLWKDQALDYWKHLEKIILKNTRSTKEAEGILKELNKSYIQDYFVRRVSRKALEHINENHSSVQKILKESIKDLSESQLEKIAKSQIQGYEVHKLGNAKDYKQLYKASDAFKKKVKDMVSEEIMEMFEWGPTRVQPQFLKKRGVTLDEYIEVEINGKKQLIKSYETSIEGTMQSYVNGMSKFLATLQLFPEYTDFAGKFSVKAGAKMEQLDLLLAKNKNKVDAVYADLAIKKQLGLDYSRKDILMNKTNDFLGKVTNYSALVGLSSPLAGVKNLLIQIPRSAAVYGVRNTYRGIAKALKAFRDPNEMIKAIERGETGYGQKELLFGTDKKIQWWFKNVNFMEATENFNRIMAAEAGRLHFASLVPVLRGEASMFYPKGKSAEVMRMLKETFKLKDKDIDFLKNEADLYNSSKYESILDYAGFSAHKASAGATGVSDLPLWMSQRYFKPLTLFMRMAGSVTIDSYKNYVKPMKNGNYAPMIKALIAHGVSGATLYAIYDKLLDQQVPTEEAPALDKAFSYIWRGEMLGVFGEILSPYTREGNLNPLMEPVIIRNAREGANQLLQVFKYGKNVGQATNDFMKKTIVIYGQGDKLFTSINHPYVTKYKRIKNLENQWRRRLGLGYQEPMIDISTKRSVYYWDLKKAIMFGKSDKEIAHKYWAAYDYLLTEYEAGQVASRALREKKAKQALEAVIKKMNPIDLSIEEKGRVMSKRNEFLTSLSQKNYNLALKLENEYKYKVRRFKKIISEPRWKNKFSIYPY